ncbi:MAG TPA: EthD family reductase [Actinophytocola sp.]|nr:EthD family reductase [Actinophytocola sp.]
MIKYIALYKPPVDPEAFDKAYFSSHKPLIDKVPGLVRQEIAKVQRVFVPGMLGETEPYLVAELYFESKDAMKTAFASPEWQASGANLTEIGGMELVSMFSAEVVE